MVGSECWLTMATAAEKRRRRREKKKRLVEDVERVIKNKTPTEQVTDLKNEELFFIDEKPALDGQDKAKIGSSSSQKKQKRVKTFYAKPNQKALDRALSSKEKRQRQEVEAPLYDLWGSNGNDGGGKVAPAASVSKKREKRQKAERVRLSTVVEPAGCSYNPQYDAHQDVVAEIVAEEAQRELIEQANRTSTAAVPSETKRTAEEQRLRKPHEIPSQRFVPIKKTLKAIRREERERAERVERKREEAEERAKVLPPRLGRKRFQPETKKVATTDEIDGSIRTLRSTPMVATSAFNKLQRKGLIEPRDEAVKRRRRRYVRA